MDINTHSKLFSFMYFGDLELEKKRWLRDYFRNLHHNAWSQSHLSRLRHHSKYQGRILIEGAPFFFSAFLCFFCA